MPNLLLTSPHPSKKFKRPPTRPQQTNTTIIKHNMHHHLIPAATMPSAAPSSATSSTTPLLCKHSPSATLDLLILILVVFSGTFLVSSYLSYIFHSLSLLLSSSSLSPHLPYILGFVLFFLAVLLALEFCCGSRARKCHNPNCKGLKKAMEFDLQLQTDECVRSDDVIDKLPWKGGSEGNPDYECLRAELRKMAPPNGRAVLLFRAKCGCPVAKLQGWGPRRGRKHKKALANVIANGGGGGGGGDHR